MDNVSIGSAGYRLMFESEPGDDDVLVRIESPAVRAERSVVLSYVTEGPFLPAFFAGLAAAWRGWSGERRWRSPLYDLLLAARHDRVDHVLITADLRNFAAVDARPPSQLDEWSASIVVPVEPGSLGGIADRLARLLGSHTTG